jgi:hypothetical protein
LIFLSCSTCKHSGYELQGVCLKNCHSYGSEAALHGRYYNERDKVGNNKDWKYEKEEIGFMYSMF